MDETPARGTTGVVFGYVLLAVRRDREQSRVDGQSPDVSWYE